MAGRLLGLWSCAYTNCRCTGALTPAATARPHTPQLDSTALQAALKQQQQDGGASAAGGQPLLLLWWKDGQRGWTKVPAAAAQCPAAKGAAAQLTQLVGGGRHQELADFEDHLDDLAADWLNPTLLKGPA